jgi:peptidoglycan-associated lipoprotein
MRNGKLALPLVVLMLALCLFLCGCPKKTPPPEPTKPSVSTSTEGSRTPATGGSLTSPGRETAREQAQIAALKGEDVPLESTPRKEFLDPTPAERDKLRTIYFDYDKSDIRPEYRVILEGIAQWMKDNPARNLLTEGHCDERGTNEYNLALGERRALSVRRYLIGLGVHPDRLHTISYGEEKPADPGHTEEAWARNRRAEFKITAAE